MRPCDVFLVHFALTKLLKMWIKITNSVQKVK